MSFAPGQALGNYRILSQIGVGGMGVVYLAEHPLIGKKVALKVIHQELARNREVVSRFFREAKAVNQIGNEHIVEINDFGQTPDGDYFLIMEYLEGRTLADSLGAERVLAPERSAHIGAQIAAALGAAHHASIIHRDLKPDNVMLVPKLGDRDFVKLLDFGLAKMLADGDANQLTAQGVVLGTPQYMSPEACESKKNIDQRADIYSLGILLFQMMTGSLPFWGPAMGEILVKHVTQPPPAPRGINPNIPPAMEQVVLRCLAKDPSSRFQTMSELREALLDPDRYLSSSPPVVPSSAIASGRRGTHAGRPADPDSRSTMVGKKSPADPLALAETALPPERIPASQQKTKFLDGGAPPIPRASPSVMSPTSGPDARTAFMDGPAAAPIHAPQTPDVPPPRLPDMPPPQPARNATMVIGTPAGYSNAPPRQVWPVVVAILAVLAVAGAAVVVLVWPGQSDRIAASTKVAPNDGGTDAGNDAPAMARINISSNPPGATIVDEQENKLGVTPTIIELPNDGGKRTLQLRHPKAKTREKIITVHGDTAVTVQMELLENSPVEPNDSAGGDAAEAAKKRKKKPGTRTYTAPRNKKKTSKDTGRSDTVIPPDFD